MAFVESKHYTLIYKFLFTMGSAWAVEDYRTQLLKYTKPVLGSQETNAVSMLFRSWRVIVRKFRFEDARDLSCSALPPTDRFEAGFNNFGPTRLGAIFTTCVEEIEKLALQSMSLLWALSRFFMSGVVLLDFIVTPIMLFGFLQRMSNVCKQLIYNLEQLLPFQFQSV